jgi:cyanate lyase
MTDLGLLNAKIRESGIKLNWIEEALGLSYMGLKRKLTGETEFKVSEANKIAEVLNLSKDDFDAIFCAH